MPVPPKYVLRLDDLPTCVESAGVVWPVFMSATDAGRLFHVAPDVVTGWVKERGLPGIRVGKAMFIDVAALNEWIIEHYGPLDEWEDPGELGAHRRR